MKRIIIWDSNGMFENEDDDEQLKHNNDDIDEKIKMAMIEIPKVVITPYGTYPIESPENPYNTRYIFVAHTNFDITEEHIKEIIQVPGVEGFRPLTRYSFTIAIGVAFFFEDVLFEIENVLKIDNVKESEVKTKLILDGNEELVKEAVSGIKSKFWFVYIMPNGKYIVEEFENKEQMDERCQFFIGMSHMSSGITLNSHDVPGDEDVEQ